MWQRRNVAGGGRRAVSRAVERLEVRSLLCGLPAEAHADGAALPEYRGGRASGDADTGGIIWSNRGADNFDATFGAQAAAARQVVDAAFHFWNQVIGSLNQDGGNSQIDVALTAQARGTGQGGSANVSTRIGNKPRTSTISIGGGSDANGNGTVADGEGYYLDPTPYEYAEFQGPVVNAFTGEATVGSAAANGNDLFSLVTIEMQHALGVIAWNQLAWQQDPNGYIDETSVSDTADTPGKLYTFNSPNLKALFTSNNGGAGGTDFGYAIHSARPGQNTTVNGINYQGQTDTGTTGYPAGRRYLPSYVAVQALADVYGYTVNPPQDVIGTFYSVPDRANRRVIVRNPDPLASSDRMEVRAASGGLFVTLDIGNDVAGTNMNGPFVAQFFRLAFDSVVVDGGSGNDFLRVDGNDALAVTLRGGTGDDFLDLGFVQRNLDLINGTVALEGGSGTDRIFIYDDLDATGDATTITGTMGAISSGTFDTTGFGFMSYVGAESLTYNGGSGADVVTVAGTAIPLSIDGNLGNDVAVLTNGNLDAITAPVFFDGGGGANDEVVLNDQSTIADYEYRVAAGSIARDALFAGLDFVNADTLTVNGGGGANTFRFAASVTQRVQAYGNGGDDDFLIGGGAVTPTGNNVYVGGAGVDRITFDDSQSVTPRIWDVRPGEIFFGGLIPLGTLGFESVAIYAGINADTIDVAGDFRQNLYVDAGLGNDTVTWRAADNWYYYADGGAVEAYAATFVGGAGFDALSVADANRFEASYVLDRTSIDSTEPGGVGYQGGRFDYSGFGGVDVALGASANDVLVNGTTPDIVNQTTLLLSGGNDRVTVRPRDPETGAATITALGILGGAGTDVVTIDDGASVTGATWTVNHLSGTTTQNVAVGADGLGTSLLGTLNDVETNVLIGSQAADVFDVTQYKSGTRLNVNGQAGDDTLNVGGGNVAANVTNISAFTFDGQDDADTFNVRNGSSVDNFTYPVSPTAVAVTRVFPASYSLTLNQANVETMRVYAGSGVDILNPTAVANGRALEFYGGDGDDAVNLPPDSTSIAGRLGVFGEGGTLNRVNQLSNGKATPSIVHVTANAVGAAPGDTFFAPGGSLVFDAVQALAVRLGSAADVVYAQPNAVAAITLVGGSPTGAPGDELNLALANAADAVVNGTPASGSVTSSNLRTLSWSGFEGGPTIDDVAPAVVATEFVFDAARQALSVMFGEDVGESLAGALAAGMFAVENLADGSLVTGVVLEYDAATFTARLTFPDAPYGALPDGDYRLNVGGYSDAFGNAAAATAALDFHTLAGDADRNRTVDFTDLVRLAQNYGQSGLTFSQGNFDYSDDGLVGFTDLVILAQRYGTSVGALLARVAPPPTVVTADQTAGKRRKPASRPAVTV